MRQGYRVIDMDTHVNPTLDVLLHYADRDLQSRKGDLKPYTRVIKPRQGRGESEDEEQVSMFIIKPIRYSRIAGEKLAPPENADGANDLFGRTRMATRTPVKAGVLDYNSQGRLQDMDVEGRDIDFIIPGTWSYGVAELERDLARGFYQSYHRYMSEYCSADSRRLKSMVLAPANDPEWAAQTIREQAKKDWVAAMWPVLPEGLPVDDPDLEPIWQAASEADLPIMFHSFYVEPPYFPGYRDVWDNSVMGRTAGQTWGAQRFLSFVMMGGVLDRYPNLRIGLLESGHGWLPHWLLRLTRQIEYVQGSAPHLKHSPMEYAQMGRIFCGIDLSEGLAMTKAVIDVLGNDILMFQSDYPHPETIFPDHTDAVLAWKEAIGETATQKLMWENGYRFLRLTSTPWDNEKAAPEATARR